MVYFLVETCLGHTEPRRIVNTVVVISMCLTQSTYHVAELTANGKWLRFFRLQLDSTLEEIAVLELSRQYSRYNILVREN